MTGCSASPYLLWGTAQYFGFDVFDVAARFENLTVSDVPVESEIYYIRDVSGEVVAEYDGAGNLLAEYVYASGQRIAKKNPNGALAFYLNDHLGSARAMYGNGWSANYYPFGELASQTGSAENTRYDFTARERDQGTGLIYFPYRYYDPEIGRWVSVDPLAEKFPGWSPYNYALNNPLGNFDPDGREVRFSDSTQAAIAAEALNQKHKGANIGVEKRQTKGVSFTIFGKKITIKKSKTYYALTADPKSGFDWGQNEYTSALFDVIKSDEVVFDVRFTEEGPSYVYPSIQDVSGGYTDSYPGGARVRVSAQGNLDRQGNMEEDVGTVLLHELIGHGHPLGGTDARQVNWHYGSKFVGRNHGGYHKQIQWKKTGLYRLLQQTNKARR